MHRYAGMLAVAKCGGPHTEFQPGRVDTPVFDAAERLPAPTEPLFHTVSVCLCISGHKFVRQHKRMCICVPTAAAACAVQASLQAGVSDVSAGQLYMSSAVAPVCSTASSTRWEWNSALLPCFWITVMYLCYVRQHMLLLPLLLSPLC